MGFAGYAAWRLLAAVRGPTGEDGTKATFKRIGYAARGLFYLFLFGTAVRLIVANTGDSATEQAPDWTARVFGWPGGRLLVAATGIAILAGGLYVGWRGVSKKFRKHLKGYEMTPRQQRVILWLGTVGNMARSLVFMLIGVLLIVAALQHDPTEAVGIDGALRRMAARSFGPALLSRRRRRLGPLRAVLAGRGPLPAGRGHVIGRRRRTSPLDSASRGVARATDRSLVWLALAGVLAAAGGRFGRRAAMRGLFSLASASGARGRRGRRWLPGRRRSAARRCRCRPPPRPGLPPVPARRCRPWPRPLAVLAGLGIAARVRERDERPGRRGRRCASRRSASALATRRLWPVAPHEPAEARTASTEASVKPSPTGKGVVVVVNPGAGTAESVGRGAAGRAPRRRGDRAGRRRRPGADAGEGRGPNGQATGGQ